MNSAEPEPRTVAAAAPLDATVVICAYSDARWEQLRRAVRSALEQEPGPVEVVVVIDHNVALLERAREALDGAIVIANNRAPGLNGARNAGAALGRGRVVAFLDDDAQAEPGWLAALVAGYDAGDVLGVGGRIVPEWTRGRPAWMPETFLWTVGCTFEGQSSGEVRNLIGCNMSYLRTSIEAAGGFRESIGTNAANLMRCDETELGIRMRSATPGRFVLLDGATVRHEVSPERTTFRYFVRRCYWEGRSKAELRRMVGPQRALSSERSYAARVLPRAFGRSLVRATRHGREGLQAPAIVVGFTTALAGYVRTLARPARRPGV